MGRDFGEFTLTERKFFEGHVNIDLRQDERNFNRGFTVHYSVDTDLKGWNSLQDMKEYPEHLERLIQVFQQVEVLLSHLSITETPEDFRWVQELADAKATPRKIKTLEEFSKLCIEVINDEAHHNDPGIMKGLRKFLKKKNATHQQTMDLENLLDCLADDKSELSGSPDSNVVDRFQKHEDDLFKILHGVLGNDFNLPI